MKNPTFITCIVSVEILLLSDLFKPNYANWRALDYDMELLIPYLFNKKRGAKKKVISCDEGRQMFLCPRVTFGHKNRQLLPLLVVSKGSELCLEEILHLHPVWLLTGTPVSQSQAAHRREVTYVELGRDFNRVRFEEEPCLKGASISKQLFSAWDYFDTLNFGKTFWHKHFVSVDVSACITFGW